VNTIAVPLLDAGVFRESSWTMIQGAHIGASHMYKNRQQAQHQDSEILFEYIDIRPIDDQ